MKTTKEIIHVIKYKPSKKSDIYKRDNHFKTRKEAVDYVKKLKTEFADRCFDVHIVVEVMKIAHYTEEEKKSMRESLNSFNKMLGQVLA